MAATSLPFLLPLLFLSTALLLFGGGQAAYLQQPENPGPFQEDRPIGRVQYYEPFRSYPLTDKAEYQIFDQHQPQDDFESPNAAQVESLRCDMNTDGGGWMVIQRRVPGGRVNFRRNWQDYENGFGDLNGFGELWYGLRNLHCLTTRYEVELRIDMVTKTNTKMSWTYQTFRVAGAGDKYRLTIGGGKGNGHDAMSYHNGMQFTTYDQDNDKYSIKNCAYRYQGGWWYKSCHNANLNGPHNPPSLPGVDQPLAKIVWYDGRAWQELSSVEMKIRIKCHG